MTDEESFQENFSNTGPRTAEQLYFEQHFSNKGPRTTEQLHEVFSCNETVIINESLKKDKFFYQNDNEDAVLNGVHRGSGIMIGVVPGEIS